MMKIIITKIINSFFKKTKDYSYQVNQPDIFDRYTQEQQMRQPRLNLASQNRNFYSQYPVNIDSFQPTQMQNEIPLPYYSQQHEISKSQLSNV